MKLEFVEHTSLFEHHLIDTYVSISVYLELDEDMYKQ